GLALQRLELVVGDAHVLVLGELVALHEAAPLDRLVARRTERLLLDARAALGVQQVERDVAARRRRVELDRDGHEPERDRSGAERMRWHRAWHDSTRAPIARQGLDYPRDCGAHRLRALPAEPLLVL